MGITDLDPTCEGITCDGTELDSNYTEDKPAATHQWELHLEDCSNLTVLKHSPNLHTLDLANCSSGELHADDLSALPNLGYLHLRGGHLPELSDGLFAKLPDLKVLELGGNAISRIPATTFRGLFKLWLLGLQDNNISALPDAIFLQLRKLLHLDLGNNQIETLQEGIFAGSPRLQILLLHGNPLTKVYPSTLRSPRRLILLDLSNCGLLEELHLNDAYILMLENNAMQSLSIEGSVAKLQAANNKLTHLHMSDKKSIVKLELHENKLEADDIPSMVMGMWRLDYLDLSKNFIDSLPVPSGDNTSEFFLLPNLRFLNLSNNLLEHLHSDSPLLSPSLTYLDLSYNLIYSLEPHIFSLIKELKGLHIEGNLIRQFQYDHFYQQQPRLKELSLFDNVFTTESYQAITKYFTEAGVRVIEKIQRSASGHNISEDFIDNSEPSPPKTGHRYPNRQQCANIQKWSSGDVMIWVGLLTSLVLNVVLVLFFRHARGQKCPISLFWFFGTRQRSNMEARLVSIEDSEI
ncbi:insulin-like growth factor-binding protein complex acid labile subunit [Drosophila kikkawai]|uniref:Insulin-like growth factor-binding protein complex acid labile subunit n=1 Tax=Drosophila kikkawai TaxID=30033 RepID=A0A6P4HPY7_DROKI